MAKINAHDLRPLESFPLVWRWTDKRWNKLPADALESIRPLSESKAGELFEATTGWVAGDSLARDLFHTKERFDNRTQDGAEPARAWLRALWPEDEPVIVSWSNQLALVTPWSTFCEYWDDFCYPMEDVLVWPYSQRWALFYHHEEILAFGLRLGAA